MRTGAPVVDNQNTMTAGPRGPALLQDVWFLEKLAHFDREVIPERRMHAKGSGAYLIYKKAKKKKKSLSLSTPTQRSTSFPATASSKRFSLIRWKIAMKETLKSILI